MTATKDQPEERTKRFKELGESKLAEAIAMLTDEQKKTWAELIGKPFKAKE